MPARDRRELRKTLLAVAGPQSGYFTAAQALKAGYSYPAQRYHALRNNWLHIDRGLYRLPEWPPSTHEDLVRWTLWSRHKGVVSHDTALVVHGLGDVNPEKVHFTVPPGFRAKAEGVVLHRGVVESSEREEHTGFSVTTPLRSMVDVAAGPLDLDQLATAISEAIRRGLATPQRLRLRAEATDNRAALRIERALSMLNAEQPTEPSETDYQEPVRRISFKRE